MRCNKELNEITKQVSLTVDTFICIRLLFGLSRNGHLELKKKEVNAQLWEGYFSLNGTSWEGRRR